MVKFDIAGISTVLKPSTTASATAEFAMFASSAALWALAPAA